MHADIGTGCCTGHHPDTPVPCTSHSPETLKSQTRQCVQEGLNRASPTSMNLEPPATPFDSLSRTCRPPVGRAEALDAATSMALVRPRHYFHDHHTGATFFSRAAWLFESERVPYLSAYRILPSLSCSSPICMNASKTEHGSC